MTTKTAPAKYSVKQKKQLVVRETYFTIIAGQLYKLGPDEVLQRYVLDHEKPMILTEAHASIAGGHYLGKPIVWKVLTIGLWWPTLHKDAKEFCRSCDMCQCTGRPSRRDEIPLKPQVTLQAFDKWDIDFVGPINPPGKRTGSRYTITIINYLTRWVEAKPIKDYSIVTAVHLQQRNLFLRTSSQGLDARGFC